jgi:hypothetical protein
MKLPSALPGTDLHHEPASTISHCGASHRKSISTAGLLAQVLATKYAFLPLYRQEGIPALELSVPINHR